MGVASEKETKTLAKEILDVDGDARVGVFSPGKRQISLRPDMAFVIAGFEVVADNPTGERVWLVDKIMERTHELLAESLLWQLAWAGDKANWSVRGRLRLDIQTPR